MPGFAVRTLAAALAVLVLLALNAGQAHATHVQCGDVITQDTTLDSDLIDCRGDGLVVGADDITIDLGGHTISHASLYTSDRAINNYGSFPDWDGHDGVTVQNGTIGRHFGGAIELANARRNVLRNLTVLGGGSDGAAIGISHGSDYNRIENNLVYGEYVGVHLGDGTHNNQIAHNTITENDVLGVNVAAGSNRNEITGNTISDNGFADIYLDDAHDNRIEGNDLVSRLYEDQPRRKKHGLYLQRGSSGNTIRGNRGGAPGKDVVIALIDAHNNLIVANTAFDTEGVGISLVGSSGNVLRRNSATGNRDFGIRMERSTNNRLRANAASRNGGDGIAIDPGGGGEALSAGTVLRSNVADSNGDDGIDVESPGVRLTANTARQNADWGIEAVPGVIDGGGNRASGNGNPLQCLNVFCR